MTITIRLDASVDVTDSYITNKDCVTVFLAALGRALRYSLYHTLYTPVRMAYRSLQERFAVYVICPIVILKPIEHTLSCHIIPHQYVDNTMGLHLRVLIRGQPLVPS